jgi:hypothetical protein
LQGEFGDTTLEEWYFESKLNTNNWGQLVNSPDPSTRLKDKVNTGLALPIDPNEKIEPAGYGTTNFIDSNDLLSYSVYFENQPDATAPAHIIKVIDTLDNDLNLSTFELTEIAFADHLIIIPEGLNHYETTMNLSIDNEFVSQTDLVVEIEVSLDMNTRELTFTMIGLDPNTGWLPEHIMLGILYPNDQTGRGEGHISYIVKPISGSPSGTQITNMARIYFDWNDPIDTPLVLNTLDSTEPTSTVDPLPAIINSIDLTVSWSGQDDPNGSGIAYYDIYVSDNGGPFQLWLGSMTDTTALFTGQDQHTYAFYSIAADNVGHVEIPPGIPDAVTTIQLNQPPIADAGGPYTISEGGSIQLDATNTTDPDLPGDVLIYEWDFDSDGQYDDATGIQPTFSAALLDGPTSVTIGLKVTDSYNEVDTDTAIVQVVNVAPQITAVGLDSTTIEENGTVMLSGSFTDPGMLDTHLVVIDWGDGQTSTATVDQAASTFAASHQYLDDVSGGYTISVILSDDDGGQDTTLTSVMVDNIAPVITSLSNSSPKVGDALEGEEVTISAIYMDVGTLDTHTAMINWGDGTIEQGEINSLDQTVAGSHVYSSGGVYRITLTVSDDDSDSDVATTTAYITGVGINDGVLQVVGTATDDHVVVGKLCSKFIVIGNFLPGFWHTRTLDTTGVTRIEVVLGDGNDRAVVASNVETTALIDGGTGNDLLKGGRGDDILLGGDGHDLLIGCSGRDLMIGGLGWDRIIGNFGDDIIIGGTTAFDANYMALLTIMNEWTSDRSYTTRIENLKGTGTGDRLNGDYFLIAQNSGELDPNATVFDDDARDKMTGGAGFDWFFANYCHDDEGKRDRITDLKAAEFAEDLDFILEEVIVEEIPGSP